jgi:hypothetical protein
MGQRKQPSMDKNKEHNYCFFTVATGKKYLQFAFALARSYKFHNDIAIPFYIVSDSDFSTPPDLSWVKKKIITSQLMSTGVACKLNFDQIAPATNSIFIDADSIIYNDISDLFNLPNTSLQVIGMQITTGKWVDLELPTALAAFKIDYLVRFSGAFYYIIKNALTETICADARQLAASDYPFQRHGNVINDEPLFAISMARQGIKPVNDDGTIWTDIVQLKSHRDLNIFKYKASFHNSKDFRYKFWLPEGDYQSRIVHFGGGNFNKNPWLFDAMRLKLYYEYNLPKSMSNFIVGSIIKPLYFFTKSLKQLFN